MKKFLSICFCLMLCVTSICVFGACEAKPKPVSQTVAEQELAVAMNAMYGADAAKITGGGWLTGMVVIMSDDVNYSNFWGESWTVVEGGYTYEYSIMEMEFNGEPMTQAVKRLVLTEHESYEEDEIGDILQMFENMEFVSASELKGEITISYTVVEEDVPTKISFVVKGGVIKSITIGEGLFSVILNLEFGDHIQIPERPTNVEWDIYQPHIEVEGLKDYYELGEDIELSDLTILYYEDEDTHFPEEYDVDMSMISGFDTSDIHSGTITVTFYGLTYTHAYTCK